MHATVHRVRAKLRKGRLARSIRTRRTIFAKKCHATVHSSVRIYDLAWRFVFSFRIERTNMRRVDTRYQTRVSGEARARFRFFSSLRRVGRIRRARVEFETEHRVELSRNRCCTHRRSKSTGGLLLARSIPLMNFHVISESREYTRFKRCVKNMIYSPVITKAFLQTLHCRVVGRTRGLGGIVFVRVAPFSGNW